jgi:DNA polymerase-4
LSYTDLVEPLSLDEAFLDVTDPKRGPKSATLIAQAIRKEIFDTTQLTASAGVSFNKFLAKVASDINKPNGMKVITREEAPASWRLSREGLPWRRQKNGRPPGEDGFPLRSGPPPPKRVRNGATVRKMGRHLYKIVNALDDRPVNPNRIRKSIGAERTFSDDITHIREMKEKLDFLAEKIFSYLQKQDNYGRTVTLKMKRPDFTQHTRSRSYGVRFDSCRSSRILLINCWRRILRSYPPYASWASASAIFPGNTREGCNCCSPSRARLPKKNRPSRRTFFG